MQIPLRWVNELVDLTTIELTELIEKLTLGGFEVEEVLEVPVNNIKTIALDVSATANRSDSLSIQGLALEIAALINHPPKLSNYSIHNTFWSQQLETIQSIGVSQTICPNFIGIVVENITNFQSPKWMQQKLLMSGIIPENNLVDFQNYISLETGYPIETYDLNKIYSLLDSSKSFQLSLTSQNNVLEFSATNQTNYPLNNSILTVNTNTIPISIAGIISSSDIQCSTTTNKLFVEASIFNSAKIRQESRILGLRTNRSSRYEKSLNDVHLMQSVYRFISLLRIANPQVTCKLHTTTQYVAKRTNQIKLNYQTVKQILGPIKKLKNNKYGYISPQIITKALERLQFTNSYDVTNKQWNVMIPPFRFDDVTRDIDLIEEIGRIYGFNNFLTRLPAIKTIGIEDSDYQIRKKITTCLLNLGLNELIQYSLVKKSISFKNAIDLVNPLAKDYATLQSSLLPKLVKATQENFQKSNSNLEGFEYGHIFLFNSSKTLEEKESVAGIFGGIKTKSNWSEVSKSISWFEAKGKMDQFFKTLNIPITWESYHSSEIKKILHPYCMAKLVLLNGKKVGIFGRILPSLAKTLSISPDLYLFELNFDILKNEIQQTKLVTYKEYSSYPKIFKDVSFIISKKIQFDQIQHFLYANGSQFLKEVMILDEYYGESIPENSTSLCLQLVFQSNTETLQNSKVDLIVNYLSSLLIQQFNIILRT